MKHDFIVACFKIFFFPRFNKKNLLYRFAINLDSLSNLVFPNKVLFARLSSTNGTIFQRGKAFFPCLRTHVPATTDIDINCICILSRRELTDLSFVYVRISTWVVYF